MTSMRAAQAIATIPPSSPSRGGARMRTGGRALEAGFDRHLTKPVAAEALESLLQALRPRTPAGLTEKVRHPLT